jgi:hypothetical protein
LSTPSDLWFLQEATGDDDEAGEAATSHHVVAVFQNCLGWPHYKMSPQANRGTRGPIDYEIDAPSGKMIVEVKRRRVALEDAMIRKYLVQRGPGVKEFTIGVLTNLSEWKLYASGADIKEITGTPMIEVTPTIAIDSLGAIEKLRNFLGYVENKRRRTLRLTMADRTIIRIPWGKEDVA